MGKRDREEHGVGPTPTVGELNQRLRGLFAPHLERFFKEAMRRAFGYSYTIDKKKHFVEGDNRILLFLLEVGAGKASQPGDTGGTGREPAPRVLDYIDGALDATLFAALGDRTPGIDPADLRDAPSGKPLVPDPDAGGPPENEN